MPAVLRECLGRHDAEGSKHDEEHRELKEDAERQDDARGEAQVLIDGDERRQTLALEVQQKAKTDREGEEVGHPHTSRKEKDRPERPGDHVLSLLLVQGRREERPDLVGEQRKGHQDAQRDPELEAHEERRRGTREDQAALGQQRLDGSLEHTDHVEFDHNDETEHRAHDHRDEAPDDVPPQLFEVIQERHLRFVAGHHSSPDDPWAGSDGRGKSSAWPGTSYCRRLSSSRTSCSNSTIS